MGTRSITKKACHFCGVRVAFNDRVVTQDGIIRHASLAKCRRAKIERKARSIACPMCHRKHSGVCL